MSALSGLAVIMIVLGLLVGVIALVALIIMKLMKKEIKAPAILTGSALGVALLGFGLAFVANFVQVMNEPIATESAPTESYPSSSSAAQSDKESEVEEEEASEPEEDIDESQSDDSHLTKDGRDPADLSEYNADIDIRDIERNPDEYQDEWIAFEGRIVQVMEDDVTTAYRVAVNDDIDRVVYLETLTSTLEERLLEDDHVEVYGSFYDLVTYETVMGSTQTIPAFNAHGERTLLQEAVE